MGTPHNLNTQVFFYDNESVIKINSAVLYQTLLIILVNRFVGTKSHFQTRLWLSRYVQLHTDYCDFCSL